MLIGIDTGGTFTDFVFLTADGRLSVAKAPSTPEDPSRAVFDGLRLHSLSPGFVVVHGTTVATNALLERRGAKTALLTTQGCRDVLEIARQTRAELYSLAPAPRDPLIPRELRFEVPERLDGQGDVVTPLDGEAVERALDAIQAQGVESLAVCFLFSFLRPDHEQEVGRRARARGLTISLSCEIAPEYREYERTATVCANAFVAPVMARYIERLAERLNGLGAGRLAVMQSNGGTLRAEEAAANAVKTVLSGPAGGLVAAVRTARGAGIARIMTFDMGGTSTDVALVDGEPVTMRTGEVAGLPLLMPMLDIHTVGAGGGSLARVDAGGGLRVGPQSAGADPGPVAYGRGSQLTVTDANVLLGRLPSSVRLAGRLRLDAERVRAHFGVFAATLNLTPEQAAEGILAVVNAQMARALRHISVERGRDPADYTLVAFGGAGGLHACALAESLGMRRVLIPRYPGAFSALGLVLADVRREYARSLFVRASEGHKDATRSTQHAIRNADLAVRAVVSDLAAQARREMAREGVAPDAVVLESFAEARYVGQSYALRVPFRRRLMTAARAFHRMHQAHYGHADPTQPVEIVTVGLTAVGRSETAGRAALLTMGDTEGIQGEIPPVEPLGTARVWLEDGWRDAPVYAREQLKRGHQIAGPSIVVQEDATTFLEPTWRAMIDAQSNLVLESTA